MSRFLNIPLHAIFAVCISFSCFATPPADEELAKKLKKEYKDQEFVSLETSSEIQFSLDKKTSQPLITSKQRIKTISLKDYASLVYHAVYDDNSEIDPDYIAKDSKKKTIYGVDKVCQNLQVDNIFYSDSKICSYKVPLGTFASTNEFGVDVKYKDVKYFTKVLFHESFPIEKREVTFIIPEWMEVELMEMNFQGYTIEKTKVFDAKLKVNRHTYKISKLKAYDHESYTRGICHRYPHILVLSKSFTFNNQKKEILSTSDDLYKWYYGLVKSVDNQSETLKEQVTQLTTGKTTEEDKIKAIYYWVQDNIRYIAFEQGIAGYKPEGAHNVYKNKYGDCKGMANLTKEMLKLAGFDARLTWIGTTNLPYSCQIPSLAINDHMICTVFLKDKKYILDPTEKFVALGDHAERIQGKDIMIENGEKFIQDKVPVHGKDRNLTSITASLEIDGTMLKGDAKMLLKGESKKDLLYQIEMTSAKDKDKLFKYLTSRGGDKNLKVDVVKNSSPDREKDMLIDYTFKIENYVSSFNNELYVDIDPYKQYGYMKIDSTRQHDIAFGEKIYIKDVYKLKIPKGYKVKSLPDGMDTKQENFSVKLSYTLKDNQVIVEKEISIENGMIKKSEFPKWNAMVKELNKNYNDHLILIQQ